jgi:hypothetical protein
MEQKYDIQGLFYRQDNLVFRRFLEIKRKGVNIEKNDIAIIMMNPGSSKPENITDENDIKSWTTYLDKFVDTQPDDTQVQIIKLMEECEFNYAKIVNLSDIRIANSEYFFVMLEKCFTGKCLLGNCHKKYDHSIFSESNKYYLSDYFNPESIFIFAWGVDKRLNGLSTMALKILEEFYGKEIKKIGQQHNKNKNGYYHPLQKKESDKNRWISEIKKMIKEEIYL